MVSTWIDENLDHRMILHQDDPAVPVLQKLGEPVYLMDVNPTAENIARLIYDFTASRDFRSSRCGCGRRRVAMRRTEADVFAAGELPDEVVTARYIVVSYLRAYARDSLATEFNHASIGLRVAQCDRGEPV